MSDPASGGGGGGMDSARLSAMLHNQGAPGGGEPARWFRDVQFKVLSPQEVMSPMQGEIHGGKSLLGHGKGRQPRTLEKILNALQMRTTALWEGLKDIKEAAIEEIAGSIDELKAFFAGSPPNMVGGGVDVPTAELGDMSPPVTPEMEKRNRGIQGVEL